MKRQGKMTRLATRCRTQMSGALAIVLLLAATLWGYAAQAAETTTYVLTDAQGTVLAREDAHGTTIATYDYRPYGKQQTGPTTAGPGYTGHVDDPDTGLVYMQARYYDPVGRLLSVDPVAVVPGNLFSINRYSYANNNPVANIDPDGRQVAPGDDGPIAIQARYGDGSLPSLKASMEATQAGVGALPVVGDLVNINDAIQEPSATNVGAAVIGIVPEVGPAAARIFKESVNVSRAGKAFTRAGKSVVRETNAALHEGKTVCVACGRETVPAQQSRRGVTPPGNETHVDHVVPKSKGGSGSPDNGQILCRDCNLKKGAEEP